MFRFTQKQSSGS